MSAMGANRTMLQFDYEEANGRTVTAILGKTNGQAGWESIAVVIGDQAVLLQIDPDTDEIAVYLGSVPTESEEWVPVTALGFAIGSPLQRVDNGAAASLSPNGTTSALS